MTPTDKLAPRTIPLWIPLALSAGPVVALGFARFAYALILPAMVRALGWSLATAGAMNTANALGYLLGALIATRLTRRWGLGRIFLVSLAVTSLTILGTGLTGNSLMLALWRFTSGAAGGVAFVVGGGLVAKATVQEPVHRAALLLGLYFGGAGLGIVLSAWTVPMLLASLPQTVGWRVAWGVLGGISLLTLIVAGPATRHIGQGDSRAVNHRLRAPLGLRPILIAYGFYGSGYIVYMTFIVAFLEHHGAGPQEIAWFWTVLGSAAVAGAFLWGRLLSRASGGRGVAGLMGLVLCGVLLPLWSTTTLAVLGSAVLFGAAFLAVVTGVTRVAQRSLPVSQWTAALAALTVAFGLGQTLGPFVAGFVSEGGGGVRYGLTLSALILSLGGAVALTQTDHRPEEIADATSPSE